MNFKIFILGLLSVLIISCGRAVDIKEKFLDSSTANSRFLKSIGFSGPYSSVGSAATPVIEIEVPNALGVLQLFSDSSCSTTKLIGHKHVDGNVESVRVRLANLYEGNITIYAKFTDNNMQETTFKEVDQKLLQ